MSISVSAQINKGQWLVGGNIAGMYQKQSENDYITKQLQLPLDIGYFAGNGIAIGLRGKGSIQKESFDYTSSYMYYQFKVNQTTQEYTYGPFIRAYLLPQKSIFNLFIDVQYGYGYSETKEELRTSSNALISSDKSSNKVQQYTLSLAPVLFLNNHVSLEFILAYNRSILMNSDLHSDAFLFGTGLQIHLGKGKLKAKAEQPK